MQPRQYSKEEWESRRGDIERIYSSGNLVDVMKFLGEQGFPVTQVGRPRQLKRKFEAWSLRKNFKREERNAIVRKRNRLKASGLTVEDFRIGNRSIGASKIDRWMKKEGLLKAASEGVAPDTPPNTTYRISDRMEQADAVEKIGSKPPDSVDRYSASAVYKSTTSISTAENDCQSRQLDEDQPVVQLGGDIDNCSSWYSTPQSSDKIVYEPSHRMQSLHSTTMETLSMVTVNFTDFHSRKRKKKNEAAVLIQYNPERTVRQSTDFPQQNTYQVKTRDLRALYMFGFTTVRQLDSSISMILPPVFDKPFLRVEEEKQRDWVHEMDIRHGSKHPLTLDALFKLADVLRQQYRLDACEDLFHTVAVAFQQLLGDGNRSTIRAFRPLAGVFVRQDRGDEAMNLIKKLECSGTYFLGAEDEMTLRILRTKSTLYYKSGDYRESELLDRSLFNISSKIRGPKSQRTLGIALDLATSLCAQEKFVESKSIIEGVINAVEALNDASWGAMMILEGKRKLSKVLMGQGATEDADLIKRKVDRELEILRPGIHPECGIVVY